MARNLGAKVAGYDLSPAITARRILMCEVNPLATCLEQVYKPLDRYLEALARQQPKSIWCAHGKPFQLQNEPGWNVNVYIIGSDNSVWYLATVLDEAQSQYDWEWLLNTYKRSSHYASLIAHGPQTIRRLYRMCMIPTTSKQLRQPALTQAVRHYLTTFAPSLENVPVQWIDSKTGAAIEGITWEEACRSARPQTAKEREAIRRQELI